MDSDAAHTEACGCYRVDFSLGDIRGIEGGT